MDLELITEDVVRSRHVVILPNGRRSLMRDDQTAGLGIVHMTYLSRAMEWVSLKKVVSLWFSQTRKLDLVDEVDQIMIGWKHLLSIVILMYFPKSVFCDFSITKFMANTPSYACSHKHWERFLDPSTVDTDTTHLFPHVRTSNLESVQCRELRAIMACGLNHIPLKQTKKIGDCGGTHFCMVLDCLLT